MRRRLDFGRKGAILLTALLLLTLPLLSSYGGTTLDNVELHPPARGLIHALRQEASTNMSDNGYSVAASVSLVDETLGKGLAVHLKLQVRGPDGSPVNRFTEEMTKLMHLIVVSSDLSYFAHEHPVYRGSGMFEVDLTLPSEDEYIFISEFVPDSAGITVYKQRVVIGDEGGAPRAAELIPDSVRTQQAGRLAVELTIMPEAEEVRTGQMVMLNYAFTDPSTGERVELEPYLGTGGHCVILSEDASQYVHVHAAAEMSTSDNKMFHTEFPARGRYKVWGQFQYEGELLVVPHVIEVE